MKTEEYYNTIKSYLQKKELSSLNTGLNGRCSISIFMFEFYRISCNTEAYNYGIELIETELNGIDLISNISMYDGLCGIGWTLQHLSKEKLIDFNPDSYLSQYIEKPLMRFRDSNVNFRDPIQLEYFSDLLFYFSDRLSYTNKKLQKENYIHTLNQTLIILNNQLLQIEKHNDHQNISFENIFSIIRSLVYLSEMNFSSPLISGLLKKIILWIEDKKSHKRPTAFELFILEKAIPDLASSQLIARKYFTENKISENNYTTEINNLGIWNNSIINHAIRNITALNTKKASGLEYILEYQYNS
ncbi:hypothetical protein [Chryseobacterium sp. OSA05B]|uniref:hypothetical protein n=1 Tax=Chryseobacterium sp. OSA05B TaxID=2862650 RepID=UPI001CBE10BC|nr:hypothetical protein [Chryseobacterium sp. OSA05B]